MNDIEWRFSSRIGKGERAAYSQEKWQTMFGKLPSYLVAKS